MVWLTTFVFVKSCVAIMIYLLNIEKKPCKPQSLDIIPIYQISFSKKKRLRQSSR